MSEQEHIRKLKKSRRIIGELAPIIIDSDGEILAGTYRKEAGWLRTYQVDTVALAKKWEVPRTVAKEMIKQSSNVQRIVPKKETQASLLKMAEAFETQGIPIERIATEVTKRVPFTDRYVRELLPDKYKMVQMAREIAELVPQKPKVEAKEYKPKETWAHRKAVMMPQISKMEEAVLVKLEQKGLHPEVQKEFCLRSTRPDYYFPQQNLAIYLDGAEVHKGREDRDEAIRELLIKRHGVRVVNIAYEGTSQTAQDEIVRKIERALH